MVFSIHQKDLTDLVNERYIGSEFTVITNEAPDNGFTGDDEDEDGSLWLFVFERVSDGATRSFSYVKRSTGFVIEDIADPFDEIGFKIIRAKDARSKH